MTGHSKAAIARLSKVDPHLYCCYDGSGHGCVGVCAPLGMQREVLLHRATLEITGGSTWRWAQAFFNEPNPYPCPDDPRRHHVLLERIE